MPDRMIQDGILSSQLPPVDIRIILNLKAPGLEAEASSTQKQYVVSGRDMKTATSPQIDRNADLLNGIDVYFGMTLSGTFMHSHGTALASSSGKKLWILYSPEKQCKLATASGARMFAQANLPPLCDETEPHIYNIKNKHHPNSSRCLGHLHPLEMLRKMLDLEEEARPILSLTNPGDAIVIPERWMHMTINLDDQFTVSYRFQPSWPPHLGCPNRGSSNSSSGIIGMENFEVNAT